MEQLGQAHAVMHNLFMRLIADRSALDLTTKRYAERDAQSRELLSAMGDFTERQRRAHDDVRGLLEKRSKSDRVLEENVARMFKEKRETDERIGREIEEVFEESVRGAQEIERLLRRFDIAMPPADGFENPGSVHPGSDERPRLTSISPVSSPFTSFSDASDPFTNSLVSPTLSSSEPVNNKFVNLTSLDTPKQLSSLPSPSLLPDVPETKAEPQEWGFVEYAEKDWESESAKIKPPASLAEYDQSEMATPVKLQLEPVDIKVQVPIPEWAVGTARDIKVNGVRVWKGGFVHLSVVILDSRTELGALKELTQQLTKYHRATIHKLEGVSLGDFVSIQSSYSSAWHRGKIRKTFDRDGVAEVFFIDWGHHENIHKTKIRPLPTLFRFLPQHAQMACLSFVHFPDSQNPHHAEALKALKKACAGRKLTAKLEDNSTSVLKLSLADPGVDLNDILASINGRLVRAGLARIKSY
ncbi:hypothetical protein EWM64_g3765, partial [Hericium alpestre]